MMHIYVKGAINGCLLPTMSCAVYFPLLHAAILTALLYGRRPTPPQGTPTCRDLPHNQGTQLLYCALLQQYRLLTI